MVKGLVEGRSMIHHVEEVTGLQSRESTLVRRGAILIHGFFFSDENLLGTPPNYRKVREKTFREKKTFVAPNPDPHPLEGCGSGFGLVPGYTTLSVRVRANT